jgi:putative nucleotidyltransferase with HDIG domain
VQQSDLLDELRRLPMRHSVVTQVLGVLDDPDSSAREVAGSLEGDPSLSVRVLHLANSPYFGLSGKVSNVERAVIALGNSVIRSLAVSTAAGLFAERSDQMPAGFWAHSVSVAAATALVAQTAHVSSGDALCAGLLHDLGSALAFRYQPEQHEACLLAGPDGLLVAEVAAFGADHGALGALALEAWHLPEHIVTAVRSHHDDEHAGVDTAADTAGARASVTRCVRAGEALAVLLAGETGPRPVEPERDLHEVLNAAGLGDIDIDDLLTKVDERTDDLGALLAA